MVDDRLIEGLSRYLDGDLDPADTHEMETLLEADQALRKELSGLQDLRLSLARLADREHPPATLDALIEPLTRGRAAAVNIRPWAKIFATAAVAVLGATIIFEVNRSEIGSKTNPTRVEKGIEEERPALPQAAPTPPRPTTEGERPRGAVDRLIASPDPEVDTLDDLPPALEVIGPLQVADEGVLDSRSRAVGESGAALSAPSEENLKTAGDTAPGRDRRDGMEIEQPTTGAKLYIFMEEKTAWRGFEPNIRCESGRYALRIRVVDGVVREVWPVGRPPAAPSQHLRAGEIILGLEVDGVADGEYAAEVTIEPRPHQTR